ncbi:MAG: ATP-binding protein [Nitrospira sp.]|nr:ATP-binding protein [Nitrospira sp.]
MTIVRSVTEKAKRYLEDDEILLFVGARQAGKTTILRQLESYLKKDRRPVYFLNLEDPDYLGLLNVSPKNLFKIFTFDLSRKNFVFIDEVQYLRNPSNFLKFLYDEYKGRIKLIVSGSSAFYIDKRFRDSLAGRKRIFDVLTLSFRDFLLFKKEDDLADKDFEDLSLSEKEKTGLYYQEYMIYGGYPRVVLAPMEEKIDMLRDIAYSYVKKDIFEANIRQDEIFYKLMKLLAWQAGNLVNASELANTLGVSKTSIDNYLYVMQKSFHITLIKPFYRNARKELTKMPKVYFMDTGLRNFFVDNFKPLNFREDKGALLENIVFRQLLEKYNADEIKFWRTADKHEVDFILKEEKAIEVKTQLTQFREKDYKTFMELYSAIELEVVTFEARKDTVSNHKVIESWKI